MSQPPEQPAPPWSSGRAVALVGATTGVLLTLLGLDPTGSTFTNASVLVLASTAAVWAAAWAPWWAIGAIGATAATLGGSWPAVVLGLLVALDGIVLWHLEERRRVPWAALVGASMISLAGARELGGWGVNAAISIGLVAVLAAIGLARRPTHRRLALIAMGVTTLVGIGVSTLAVLVGGSARDDLASGNREARAGLRRIESGEFDRARESFSAATVAFERAADSLGSPLVTPARLVPVVSQHVDAGARLSTAAFEATRTVERQLRTIDVETLRISDGRIDLDAVRSLSGSMTELQAAIDELDQAVDAARSGWLLDPVVRVLDDLADDLDRQRVRGEHVVAALDVAPEMLGADGERVYLVMFTTPAEVRGLGGFMGNWAEITLDQGRISLTDHGNDEQLNEGGRRPRRLDQAPSDWVDRYGQFGFVDADGLVGEVPWKNITMSPNFPSVAQVAAELYPQSGGRQIDGVFNLDVYALATLIDLVGPISVEGVPDPLTGDNAVDFLLFEQYLTDDHAARGDMLDAVTTAAVERLLRSNPPDPLDLGKAMAPLTRERRVMAWARHDAEQELFERLDLDGSLRSNEEHMVSVAVVNGGGSKIDSFLDHEIDVVEGRDGLELRVTLTNGAPASGLPGFIIGNAIGLPPGTSRLWVTGFASVPIIRATADGAPLRAGFGSEVGLAAVSAFVDIGPGRSTVITFDLDAGDVAPDDFDVVHPPLVR